jgi:hypothetical protein
MKYENQTAEPVILDKEIGTAWYGVIVARNTEDLSNGNFEYHPIIDFFVPDNYQPSKPSPDSPGSDFVVLQPRQTFESTIDIGVTAQYEKPTNVAGSIRPGVHVLQLEISPWDHPGTVSDFAKSWRGIGQLVSTVIKTQPLTIRIPRHPKVEVNCE